MIMKAKNIIIYILAALALAQTAFTEEYLVKLPQNSEQFLLAEGLKFNENFYGDSYFFPYWEEGLKNEDVNH